jgi:hypothetical protein
MRKLPGASFDTRGSVSLSFLGTPECSMGVLWRLGTAPAGESCLVPPLIHAEASLSRYNAQWVGVLKRLGTMSAGEWKAKHQGKATAEQMALFAANAHLHAKHDKLDGPPSGPSAAPPAPSTSAPTLAPSTAPAAAAPLAVAAAAPASSASAAVAAAPASAAAANPVPAAAAAAAVPAQAPAPAPAPAGGLSDVCCTPADDLMAGPARYDSPRHRTQFHSRNEG